MRIVMSSSKQINTFISTCLMLFQFVDSFAKNDILVITRAGAIRGLKADDGDYAMFMGIPYAEVDKENPFGKSVPYPKFNSIFNAYNDSDICPQIVEFNKTIVGTIDCLKLNIYVPSSATNGALLPVLVWIHGGSFRIGFAGRYLYGPRYLVRHDIILVTFNYRLGPYGFMCLDIPEVSGNQGLKDQVLALKWIKRNIKAFGGDPENMTLSGESLGGASVDFHLLSQKKKIFHKAILQSGTSLYPLFPAPVKTAPLLIAKYLGFQTENLRESLSFLAKLDARSVIRAVKELKMEDMFKACIEKEFDGISAFISRNWINADYPKIRNMPILIGFNNHETLANVLLNDSNVDISNISKILSSGFDVENERFEGMSDNVRHFYFGDKDIKDGGEELIWSTIYFESDFVFIHPTVRLLDKYMKNDAGNIYLYEFSYSGKRNVVKNRFKIAIGGASHADEVGYLFDVSYMKNNISPDDKLMIDRMTSMWANFVKFGDPTPYTSELLPVKWIPNTKYSKDNQYYMNIDRKLSMGTRPLQQRMAFWDLFYAANRNLQRVYQGENVNKV